MPSFEIGEDRTRLSFTWSLHGRDLRLHIGGGAEHVGAAALATRGADGAVSVQVAAAAGHREDELAGPAAGRLCRELGVTVCVSAGVHIERITPAEIEAVLRNAEAGTGKLAALLQDGESSG
jgi:gallate decarboxylase subunit D